MAERFAALAELPSGGRGDVRGGRRRWPQTVGALRVLRRPRRAASPRRSCGAGSSSTPTRWRSRSRSCARVPRVVDEFRERYRVVLLDEYQDTRVVQTWLLAELFAGHPVMAVGDPNQSIYGWRGASAANLEQLRARSSAAARCRTSRCRRAGATATASSMSPTRSSSRSPPRPGCGVERLDAGAERERPARRRDRSRRPCSTRPRPPRCWLKQRLDARDERRRAARPRRCCSAPARRRRVFIEALREHGVPFHVLGIGGLHGRARDRRPGQRARGA